ncbi:MAG: FG-GAP-like repeat-containing protein [Planctomycetota bacterium]
MSRFLLLSLGVAIGALAMLLLPRKAPTQPARDLPEAYARALAYYSNETNADARRARLELLPFARTESDNADWRLNMALIDLAELNHPVQDEDYILGEPSSYIELLQSALGHLERARALRPDDDAIAFNLARTYKKLAPYADEDEPYVRGALELLQPLAESDTSDAAALIQYGELLSEYRKDAQRVYDAYDRVVQRGADFVTETKFRVSEFRRARAMLRIEPDKGRALLEAANEKYPERSKPSADALERGQYTKLREMTGKPSSSADPRRMGWRQVTARTLLPARAPDGAFALADFDRDGTRDVVMGTPDGMRLLRNQRNATFLDLTEFAGLPLDFPAADVGFADFDNDGRLDFVVGGARGARLFLNRTDKKNAPTEFRFEELPINVRIPVSTVVAWDLDHDNDVDLFLGGPQGNRVLRTVVDETPDKTTVSFADITEKVGMAQPAARDALLLDADDDHDVDLLIAAHDPSQSCWFDNLRTLTFERKPLAFAAPLSVADMDHDFVEEVCAGGTLYDFDGETFVKVGARIALVDLDGDGFCDEDPLAGIEPTGTVRRLLAADLNRDGGGDLVVITDDGFEIYMSRPERPTAWIDVEPRGGASNAAGIGTKLRLFAGDLRVGATCRDGMVSFAAGRRTLVDCVLLRWTNGIEQGVVTPNLQQTLAIEEREGEVGSCPFLYTWDGEKWNFIADVQSGVPLGLPVADGVYLKARSNETILIENGMLQPVGDELRVNITEEFRELLYLDAVVLRAIDRPADVRPVLNEGFTIFKFPEFRVFPLRDLRPVRKATDHKGRDWTKQLTVRDRKHAVVFDKLRAKQYEGLAHPWSIELDFGDVAASERLLLVMDGWVEFPTASASIAQSQSKTVRFQPPVLDWKQPDGTWKRIHDDPGFPAGKMKSVLVDLTGKVPAGAMVLRVSSTQRLHWDSFFLATGPDQEMRLTRLPLRSAVHGFHGVGVRIEDPAGELPWQYSHDEHVTFHRWDQMPAGMLTKYGDVKALLKTIDDRYPVLATGDRIEMVFDATALPPLPDGWVRDYCFTTEGWVKDADMNQASRESVRPLPFHGMSQYPYDEAKESHPHPEWVAEWFTRPARELVNPEALGASPGANK